MRAGLERAAIESYLDARQAVWEYLAAISVCITSYQPRPDEDEVGYRDMGEYANLWLHNVQRLAHLEESHGRKRSDFDEFRPGFIQYDMYKQFLDALVVELAYAHGVNEEDVDDAKA